MNMDASASPTIVSSHSLPLTPPGIHTPYRGSVSWNVDLCAEFTFIDLQSKKCPRRPRIPRAFLFSSIVGFETSAKKIRARSDDERRHDLAVSPALFPDDDPVVYRPSSMNHAGMVGRSSGFLRDRAERGGPSREKGISWRMVGRPWHFPRARQASLRTAWFQKSSSSLARSPACGQWALCDRERAT